MKKIIFTSFLIIIAFAIGFVLGRQTVSIEYPLPASTEDYESDVLNTESATSTEAQVENTIKTEAETTSVETSQLTPEQRKLLGTFGIDADTLVVTATMITCAETKIGKVRLAEIFAGGTPTFFEGVDLFSCYQQ